MTHHRGYMRERPLGSGNWHLAVSQGFGSDGRRRQFYKTTRGTKKQAATALAQFITEVENGTLSGAAGMTLVEYLRKWLEDFARPRIAATTFRRYQRDIERFVIPTLGHVRLAKLKPGDLQSAYAVWQRERHDGRKGTLSAQTIAHVHRVLHSALATALRQGAVSRNVAEATSPPRMVRKEMSVLDREQVGRLLTMASGGDMEFVITLGLACGLRRGELLGLRWKDCDQTRGTLVVAQALEYTPEAGMRFKAPKSGKARVIAMPTIVLEALRRQKARQNEARLRAGSAYQTGLDLVIAAEDGSPINPGRLASAFRQIVKKAGLPHCGLHTMRHTAATLALSAGANPLVISQMLGHHDPGFTLRQYAHALPTMQAQAASEMDATLRGALAEDALLTRAKGAS
jgi:integrase